MLDLQCIVPFDFLDYVRIFSNVTSLYNVCLIKDNQFEWPTYFLILDYTYILVI